MSAFRRLGIAAALVGTISVSLPRSVAAQSVFVVNSGGDTGDSNPGDGVCFTAAGGCTLRAAIQEANALAGVDTINFAIGSGVQTINVGSGLTVTSAATIDGTTQPGFAGAPLIVVHGGSGDGLTVTGGGTTVRGLVINGFAGNGVTLRNGGNNVLEGNYIGTDASGTAGVGNGAAGVLIDGSAGNRIGGRVRAQRNVISGNTGKGNLGGIKIDGGATGNVIQGNFIGTDVTGRLPLGNEGRGIAIHDGSDNFVGGALSGAGNLISANRATGVRVMQGTGNQVLGNWIGTDATGAINFGVMSNARAVQFRSDNNTAAGNILAGNLYDGVLFYSGSASNNLIQQNTIFGNGLNGIGAYTGTGNRFLSNSIFDNAYIGITLANNDFDQVTPNDPGDGDTGTNNLQNFPVLTAVTRSASTTTVQGTLNSTANGSFRVQLFANPACSSYGHGEGRYCVADFTVVTNGSGNGAFSSVLGFVLPAGWVITSTATDANGNTSEFSACKG